MKLFSAELLISGKSRTAKAVVIQKTRSGYALLNNYITEPENLKSLSSGLPVLFCVDYYDTIIDTVQIPPVKDPRTFKMLAANKLRDRMAEGMKYLMAYKLDDTVQPDKSGSAEHKVFMIPEQLFESDAGLTKKQKVRSDMFTLSDFALCGVSNHYFSRETVFHAFADEEKIVMTVSRGKTIFYTRAMEYHHAEGAALESIFYETVNLTYMFATKNLRISVDRMILSGLLSDKTDLSRMLFEFNSKPQVTVIPSDFVQNCSVHTFMKFMIPISLCMLDEAYDFTPEHYREERSFNAVKSVANIITAAAVAALIFLNISAYGTFTSAKRMFASEAGKVKMKLEQKVKSFSGSDGRRYGYYYFKQIQGASHGAFDIYADTAELLATADYPVVRFTAGRDSQTLTVTGKNTFASFAEMDRFRRKLDGELEKIQQTGGYTVTNSTRMDMSRLVSDVNLTIKRSTK